MTAPVDDPPVSVMSRLVSGVGGGLTTLALRFAPRASVRMFGFIEARRPQSSLAVLDRLVRPSDIVVDAGAHRGVFTERLARLVGPRGHVHAFEPNPDSWRILSAVKGRRANISLHRIGLSDRAGHATLFRPRPNGRRVDAMSSLSKPGERSTIDHDPVEVSLDRLDAVLTSELRPIALIKVDVEGHELAVLRGSTDILRRCRPTILVEIEQRHQQEDIAQTFAFLVDLGYRGAFLAPDGLRPLSEFDVRRHQLDLLPKAFAVGRPSPGYVSDFVFVSPDRATMVAGVGGAAVSSR